MNDPLRRSGATPGDAAAALFHEDRGRLIGLAYRITGSRSDAEDAVQDAWVRWQRLEPAGRDAVERPAAWFTTAVSRLALDRLRAAHHQREVYVGPWLPEPMVTRVDEAPVEHAELAESLTLAFLGVLERLDPVERAVFVLAEVFGEPFAAIAPIVDRSVEACRQIAHRARTRVRTEHRLRRPTAKPDALIGAFLGACLAGDLDSLRRVLAADVVLVSDGGPLVHAARRPVVGADRVARFALNLAKRFPADVEVFPARVNGDAGVVTFRNGMPWYVLAVESDGEQIAIIRLIINPAKLHPTYLLGFLPSSAPAILPKLG